MIASLYAGATLLLQPISFGPVQLRVAEALSLLPFYIPEAIPGLFVGCILSNMLGGLGPIDIILGSAATFAAAWLTYRMPNMWLAALPPVVINAAVVGGYLSFLTDTPAYLSIVYLAVSQTAVCFGLGIPLCRLIMRTKIFEGFISSKGSRPEESGENKS